MAVETIKMPQLGESVTEGSISNWLVSVGDRINKYDPIAEVITDKVSAEVPSSYTGVIKEIVAKEGETYGVGETICTIEVEGAMDNQEKTPATSSYDKEIPVAESKVKESQMNKKRYSPAVLRLSQEHDINLEQVEGTGAGGRITRKDVQRVIASGQNGEKVTKNMSEEKAPVKETLIPMPTISKREGDIEIPVSGVRKAIASKMTQSKKEIPHAWMMVEVDVTNLVAFRNKVKTEFKNKEGYNLTFFAFFIKAVAQALKEYPQMNSTWAGDKIIQRKDIHISIAVATDEELFVPVIRNADEKSIKGIAREIVELAKKARDDKLTTDDVKDGTFTINNTGSFGSVQSVGIINYPQAAILQVESIIKRPVVINDMIAIRDMINLCLSLDHRVLDGLICGKFLGRVKDILENISDKNTSVY